MMRRSRWKCEQAKQYCQYTHIWEPRLGEQRFLRGMANWAGVLRRVKVPSRMHWSMACGWIA